MKGHSPQATEEFKLILGRLGVFFQFILGHVGELVPPKEADLCPLSRRHRVHPRHLRTSALTSNHVRELKHVPLAVDCSLWQL